MDKFEMEINNKDYFGVDKIDIKVLNEEELDNAMGLYFKCPFRKYPTSNNFRPCLKRECMAFRANDRAFWCAMLEPAKGEEKALHPIEMIDEMGVDW